MESRAREPVVYKAILDPLIFDNARFWRGIADYKNGRLEEYVIQAEKIVKSDRISDKSVSWPIYSEFYGDHIVHPCLNDMLYMLCGPRLGQNAAAAEDEAAIEKIVLDSRILVGDSYFHIRELKSVFREYGGQSQKTILGEHKWLQRVSPANPYPGFMGHKDFVVPTVIQRPISNAFWLSVLLITAGTVTLICAFAFMQAASLAAGGLIVAGVSAAALFKGISLFCSEREESAHYNRLVESAISGWRPIP